MARALDDQAYPCLRRELHACFHVCYSCGIDDESWIARQYAWSACVWEAGVIIIVSTDRVFRVPIRTDPEKASRCTGDVIVGGR